MNRKNHIQIVSVENFVYANLEREEYKNMEKGGDKQMYIPEFVCGIFFILMVEVAAAIILGLYYGKNKK